MKQGEIRAKLARYHHPKSDTILLEVIEGTPHSPEGGVWVEIPVAELETLTEDSAFDRDASGYGRHLDRWSAEGLITERERGMGRS